MNLARVISDAMHGRAHLRRGPLPGVARTLSPEEFLRKEVWPLFREARQALDARGITAVALQPAAADPTHSFTLLILDCRRDFEDACLLRFLVHNRQLHFRVKHPRRSDEYPVPFDSPVSVAPVQDVIEDFLYQSLFSGNMRSQAPRHGERSQPREQPLCGMVELSPAQ